MKKSKKSSYTLAICLMLFFASSIPSIAEYPDQPIKLLVGFKAGGGTRT
jgi:tripartite-type tricarboxylate transporter receptor subunit TctC